MKVIEPSEILIDAEGTIRDQPIKATPWVRFIARMFDYSIFFMGIYCFRRFIFAFEAPDTLIPFEYFLWIPVEALFLTLLGKTPGKWILGIDLSHAKSRKFEFSSAIRRSFNVWFRGLGMGVPFINGLCMLVAYNRLKVFQITSWDRDEHVLVSYRRIGKWRLYLASAIAIIGLFTYFSHRNDRIEKAYRSANSRVI